MTCDRNKYFYNSRNIQMFLNFNRSSFSFMPKVYAATSQETSEPDYMIHYKEKVKKYMCEESGRGRLKKMFSKNELGYWSPELLYVVKAGYTCLVVFSIYGAFRGIKRGREDFMRKHVETPFESQFKARRQLTDTMTLSGVRHALRYGGKFGSFSFLYLLLTTSLATYHNDMFILDHVASGAFIGALFRFSYGLKGMAVSTCLGTVLGLVAGCTLKLSMKLAGITYAEMRFYQHETYWKEYYSKLTEK